MSAAAFGVQLAVGLQKAWISVAIAPMTTVVQVALPLAMITMVTVVRQKSPPVVQNPCTFPEQKMPNEGSLVFMQSLACSSSNTACYQEGENASKAADKAEKMFEGLQQQLTPIMANPKKMQAVSKLPQVVKVVSSVAKKMQDPELKGMLNSSLQLGSFFKDRAAIESYISKQLSLSADLVQFFFNASVNLPYFLTLGKIPNSREVACNASHLQKFLQFPKGAPAEAISSALCHINGSKIANLTEILQKHLSAERLIRLVASISRLGGGFNVSLALLDAARLVEYLPKLKSMLLSNVDLSMVAELLRLAAITQNPAVMQMQAIAKQLQQLQPALDALFGNASEWQALRNLIGPLSHLVPLAERFFKIAHWPQTQLKDIVTPKMMKLLQMAPGNHGQAVLNARVTFVQLPILTQQLLSGSSAHQALCENPGFPAFVAMPNMSVNVLVNEVRWMLCYHKVSELKGDLKQFFNATKVEQMASRFSANLPSAKDWTDLLAALKAIPQSAAELQRLQPILQRLPAAFDAISKSLNSTQPMLQIAPLLDLGDKLVSFLPSELRAFTSILKDGVLGSVKGQLRMKAFFTNMDAYLKKNGESLLPLLKKANNLTIAWDLVVFREFFFDDLPQYMAGTLPRFYLTERHCKMVLRMYKVSVPGICDFSPTSPLMRMANTVRAAVEKDVEEFEEMLRQNGSSLAVWSRALALVSTNLLDLRTVGKYPDFLKVLKMITPSYFVIPYMEILNLLYKFVQHDGGTSVFRSLERTELPNNLTSLIRDALNVEYREMIKYKAILDRLDNNTLPAAFFSNPDTRVLANSFLTNGPAILRLLARAVANPGPMLQALLGKRLCTDVTLSQLLQRYNSDSVDLKTINKAFCDVLKNSTSSLKQLQQDLDSVLPWVQKPVPPPSSLADVFKMQRQFEEQTNFLVNRLASTLHLEVPNATVWLSSFSLFGGAAQQLSMNSTAMQLAISQFVSLMQFLPFQALPTSTLVSLTEAMKPMNALLSKGTPLQFFYLRAFTSAFVAALPDLVAAGKAGHSIPWPPAALKGPACWHSNATNVSTIHAVSPNVQALLKVMCQLNAQGAGQLPPLYTAISKALLASNQASATSRIVAVQDFRAELTKLWNSTLNAANPSVLGVVQAANRLAQGFLRNQTWLDSLLPLYLDVISTLNSAGAADFGFKMLSKWMTLPFGMMKFLNKRHVFTQLMNGSSISAALLPSSAIQAALSQLARSLPDLLDVQAALLKDPDAMRRFATVVSGGGMPCVNFTLSSIVPASFRARMAPLDLALCGAMQQLKDRRAQSELMALYGSLWNVIALGPNVSEAAPMQASEITAILGQFQQLAAAPWNLSLLAQPFMPKQPEVLFDKVGKLRKLFLLGMDNSLSNVLSRSGLLAGQVLSVLEGVDSKNPTWRSMAASLEVQGSFYRFLAKRLDGLINGSSVPAALSSSPRFQLYLRTLVAAVPDLLEAHLALQKSGFTGTLRTALAGGRLCANFSLADLLPAAFRSKPAVQALSAALCDLVRNPGPLLSELQSDYGPLLRLFMPAPNNTARSWPDITTDLMSFQSAMDRFTHAAATLGNSTTQLLGPLVGLLEPSASRRIMASLAGLQSHFVPPNGTQLTAQSLLKTYGPMLSALDVSLSSNPTFQGVKANVAMQVAAAKLTANLMEKVANGSSISAALLPSSAIQAALSQLARSLPDLLDAQAALLKDPDATRRVAAVLSGGGMPCVNFTLSSIVPASFRARMAPLDQALCGAMLQLVGGPALGELMALYGPLVQTLNATKQSFSSLLAENVAQQERVTAAVMRIEGRIKAGGLPAMVAPFQQLMQPAFLARVNATVQGLARWAGVGANRTMEETVAALRSQLTPLVSFAEQLLEKSPAVLAQARGSMAQQIETMRMMIAILQKLNNGSSISAALLPSSAIQAALSQLVRSLPDLLDVQAALLKDPDAMRRFVTAVSGGGMPCVNFTLSSIVPASFRARMAPLDQALCGAMQQLVGGPALGELMALYGPLLKMITTPANSSSSLVALYEEYFSMTDKYTALVTKLAMAPNLAVLLKPFEQLAVPSVQANLMTKLLAIEAKFKDVFNLSVPLDPKHSLFLALGQMYAVLDVALVKDAGWAAVKHNLGVQVAVMVLINAKIEAVKNGSTFPAALIKEQQVLKVLEALVGAMPDLLGVQLMALNNSALLPGFAQGLMAAAMSGSLCRTVFLHTLLPPTFRTRPGLLNLDKELCTMMASLGNVTRDLTEDYKPLIDLFNASSSPASPASWSALVAQVTELSSNFMRLGELASNPVAWRPLVDVLRNPELLKKWQELNATEPAQAAVSTLASAYLVLDAQLSSNAQWRVVRGWLAFCEKLLTAANARLTRLMAEKNLFAAITETAALRNALNALIAVIPDLAGRATPQSLSTLATNLAGRLAANQSICAQFQLKDVIPAELRSAKTEALGTALCLALQDMPAIQTEFMRIMAAYHPNASVDINALLKAAQTTAGMLLGVSPQIQSYLQPLTSLASNDSIARFQEFLRRAANTTMDASMLASIQQMLKALESPPIGKYTKATFAILNDVEKIFFGLWGKLKAANYNLAALFKGEQTLRLVEAFNKYPQIVQAILETSAGLMGDPTKIAAFTSQYPMLCTDLNIFKGLVSVPAGQSAADLQKLICSLATVNATSLTNELMSLVPEMAVLMQKIMSFSTALPSGSFDVSVAAAKYMGLFGEIAAAAARIHPGLNSAIFNETALMALLGPGLAKVQAAALPTAPIAEVLAKYQSTVLPLLLPMLNSTHWPQTITRVMTGVKAGMELALGGFSGVQEELMKTTEGKRLLQVVQDLSPFMQTLLHTATTKPSVLSKLSSDLLAQALRANRTAGLDLLCKADFSGFAPPPGLLAFTMAAFVKNACAVQMSAMPKRLLQLMSTFMPVPATPLSAGDLATIFAQPSRLALSLSAALNGSQNALASWMALAQHLNVPMGATSSNSTTQDVIVGQLPQYLLSAANALLPLLNGTQLGTELQRSLGAALLAMRVVVAELEAWSSHTVPFRALLSNQTAVASLLQQLGAPAAHMQDLMGVPVKPKELLAVLSKADFLSALCSRGFSSVFASNSEVAKSAWSSVCKASDVAAFSALRAALTGTEIARKLSSGLSAGPNALLELQQQIMRLQALLARGPTFNVFTDLAGLAEAVSKLTPAELQKLQVNFNVIAKASVDWLNSVLLQWTQLLNGTASTQQAAQQIRMLAMLQTAAEKNLFQNGTAISAQSAAAFLQWLTSNFGQLARSFPQSGNSTAVIKQVETYLGFLGKLPAQVAELLQQKPPRPEAIAQLTSNVAQSLANLHAAVDPSTQGMALKVLLFAASLLDKVPISKGNVGLSGLMTEEAMQRSLSSGSFAAEQILMMQQPKEFLALAAASSPSNLLCNQTAFKAAFGDLPPAQWDVRLILCNASRSGGLLMVGMLRHFQLPQLMQVMSSPFDAALSKAVSDALTKLLPKLLQVKGVDLWDFASNIGPALEKFIGGAPLSGTDQKAMTDSFTMGCSLASSALSFTASLGKSFSDNIMHYMDTYLLWSNTAMSIFRNMPEATCLFSSGNFAGAVSKVAKDLDFVHLMKPPLQTCSQRAQSFLQAATGLAQVQRKTPEAWASVPTCLREMPKSLSDFSKGIEQLQILMKNVSLTGIKISPETQELLKWISSNAAASQRVTVSFQRLFSKPTSLSLIDGLLGAFINGTDDLLKTAVQVDTAALAAISPSALRAALCQPSKLQGLFRLPKALQVDFPKMAEALCKARDADLQSLLTALRLARPLASMQALGSITSFASAITGLSTTMSEIQRLDLLPKDLQSADIPSLLRHLAALEQKLGAAFQKHPIPAMVTAITDLLTRFQSASNNTAFQAVLEDLKNVTHFVASLDTITSLIPVQFQIRMFLGDTKVLEAFLQEEGMTKTAITALLDAKLSLIEIALLAERIDLGRIMCNATLLDRALEFDKSASNRNFTLQKLSASLCQEKLKNKIPQIVQQLLKSASIANYVQASFSINMADVMKDAGVTADEMKDTMKELEDMDGLFESMANMPDIDTGSDISETAQGDTTNMVSTISKTMCGSESSIETSGGSSTNFLNRRRRSVKTPQQVFCDSLIRTMSRTTSGKVLVAMIRPLLHGKILVTPNSPASRKVMSKVNATFEELNDLRSLGFSLSAAMDGVSGASSNLSSITQALNNPLVKSLFGSALGGSGDNVAQLQKLLSGSKSMKMYAGMLGNMTSCVLIDRIRFYPSETDEIYKQDLEREFKGSGLAVINFKDFEGSHTTLPKHVTYTLRVGSRLAASTRMLYSRPFPLSSTKLTDQHYLLGFSQLQAMIERGIIAIQAGRNLSDVPNIQSAKFPQPCEAKESFIRKVGKHVIAMMIAISFLCPFLMAVRDAMHERELRVERLLFAVGRSSAARWITWFVQIMLQCVLLAAILTIVFHFAKVLSYIDGWIIFVTLFAFSWALVMFAYLVAAFFSKTSIALLVAILLFFSSYVPYCFATSSIAINVPLQVYHASLVLPLMPLAFMTLYWTGFQLISTEFTWGHIYSEAYIISPAWCLLALFLDGVGYLLIGWFVRNVFGGKHGVSYPPWFFVLPSFWGFDSRPKPTKSAGWSNPYFVASGSGNSDGAEQEGICSVRIRNLIKNGDKGKPRVNGLNLDMYRDEVTVLLGPNGAGKSTTIDMLIGMTTPSSGTITIEGLDRSAQSNALRKMTGICTQENRFFPELSTKANVEYFATFRGFNSGKEAKQAVRDLLEQLGLWSVRKTPARNLSGGQKRRLCIALAFIGDPHFIVLDEPTSGVDPSARRAIWNLISSRKAGRTILLCTHHMDEAEIVGDRIAILNKGDLVACDSPMALREKFGCRYLLSLNFEPSATPAERQDVVQAARKTNPNLQLGDSSNEEVTLSVRLENGGQDLSAILEPLEAAQDSGVLRAVGVTFLALETVFMQAVRDPSPEAALAIEPNLPSSQYAFQEEQRSRSCLQASVLFYKQLLHTVRNWKTYVAILLMPALFIAITFAATFVVPKFKDYPTVQLTPAMYGPMSKAFLKTNPNDSAASLFFQNSLLNSPGMGTACMAGQSYLQKGFGLSCLSPGRSFSVRHLSAQEVSKFAAAEPCSCNAGKQQCASNYSRSWPTTWATAVTRDRLMLLSNHQSSVSAFLEARKVHHSPRDILWGGLEFGNGTYKAWYNTKGFHTQPAFYNAMSNVLLRRLVASNNGTAAQDYGITAFAHPIVDHETTLSNADVETRMVDVAIGWCIMVAVTIIPVSLALRTMEQRLNNEKFQQMFYGVSPIMYWMVNFLWDVLCCGLSLAVIALLIFAFKVPSFYANQNFVATLVTVIIYIITVLPTTYFFSRFFNTQGDTFLLVYVGLTLTALVQGAVLIMIAFSLSDTMTGLVRILEFVFMINPAFCGISSFTRMSANQMMADILKSVNVDTYKSPFTMGIIGEPCVFLAVQWLLFFVLNLLCDAPAVQAKLEGAWCRIRCWRKHTSIKYTHREGDVSMEDQTVFEERSRVQHHTDDPLVIQDLSKNFFVAQSKIRAVRNVSFGVVKGECFGLLGCNGAGKTSLFRCITGELRRHSGSSKLLGRSAHRLGNHVGYCPQTDPLDPLLTVQEMLSIYAMLRGVVSSGRQRQIDQLLLELGLTEHRNQLIKNLSGGMRRKVSLAVALLGSPELLLLDEPTAGVDAASKRKVWALLERVRTQCGILLTSHSMEEMQRLASRLALLVNGSMRTIGSCAQLKATFGSTITVTAWLRTETAELVAERLRGNFPGSQLKTRHGNVAELTIPASGASLAAVFRTMASLQQSGVRAFSLQHTSLEQIFLQLTEEQHDGMEGSEVSSNYDLCGSSNRSDSLQFDSWKKGRIFSDTTTF